MDKVKLKGSVILNPVPVVLITSRNKEGKNKKYSLIVDDENDTIELVKPHYYKIDRKTKDRSKPIPSDERKYKVKKKLFTINKYILCGRIDT